MNVLWEQAGRRGVGPWLVVGLLIGLAGSGAVATQWHNAGSGTTIQILGSGSRLSVLFTQDQRRVLIVSGTDGAALANGVGNTLPPIFHSIDVLLIDPKSSPDVVERARNLDPKVIYILPADGEPVTAQTIEKSFAIDMGAPEPLIVKVDVSGWTASINTASGTIVAGSGESLAGRGLIQIDIDDSRLAGGTDSPTVVIAPASNEDRQTGHYAAVSPGSVMTISIDGTEIHLDREFFAEEF